MRSLAIAWLLLAVAFLVMGAITGDDETTNVLVCVAIASIWIARR